MHKTIPTVNKADYLDNGLEVKRLFWDEESTPMINIYVSNYYTQSSESFSFGLFVPRDQSFLTSYLRMN